MKKVTTTTESNDSYKIEISDGLNQVNFEGSITLWGFDIGATGKTEDEAIEKLKENLLILKQKINKIEL